jgi:dCTP deaminase
MIVNGQHLLAAMPIKGMVAEKRRLHGVSYGLSEAGYDIRIKQSITMSPEHRFTLASAIEEFQMSADLVGVVHDKSTWARQGLSLFNTVIEPDWCGFLTLELVYHGGCELHIPAGAGIAQVLFSRIQADAHYDGKYQGQADMPIAARFDQ